MLDVEPQTMDHHFGQGSAFARQPGSQALPQVQVQAERQELADPRTRFGALMLATAGPAAWDCDDPFLTVFAVLTVAIVGAGCLACRCVLGVGVIDRVQDRPPVRAGELEVGVALGGPPGAVPAQQVGHDGAGRPDGRGAAVGGLEQ